MSRRGMGALLLGAVLGACAPEEPTRPAGSAAPTARELPPIASADPEPSAAPAPDAPRFEPGEAIESRVTSLSAWPQLALQEPVLRAHFGEDKLPFPLDVTMTPLPEGRRAYLVRSTKADARPEILVLDARGKVLWENEWPFRGVTPNLRHLALSSGPEGEVAVYWHDATGWVASRMWNGDGTILVDYPFLTLDNCDALSALYWPGEGYLVVASHLGKARAQLVSLRGKLRWPAEGVDVSSGHTLPSPVALALDTPESVVLLRVGLARDGGKKSPQRVLASRLDADGQALWPTAIDVGLAPAYSTKLGLSPLAPGVVAIDLGGRSFSLTSGGVLAPR